LGDVVNRLFKVTDKAKAKPLSATPLGYILAVVGGTLGAPLGWISSPIVLFVLNQTMKENNGKTPNRFAVWALIGVVGAPLSLAPVMISGLNKAGSSADTGSISSPIGSQPGQSSSSPSAPAEAPQASSGVTMENFGRLATGMTYEQVVGILGKEGTEMSSNDIGGNKTIMYMWKADGFGGANMNAMFQNGGLVSKSQFGLK
jgi:hypothetical protein